MHKKLILSCLLILLFISVQNQNNQQNTILADYKFMKTGEIYYNEDFIPITTLAELQQMNNNLSASYILMNDIDASDTRSWNNESGFIPIGNETNRFTGIFEGNNHKILNLWINRSSSNNVGLFGYLNNSIVRNLTMENCSVIGYSYCGILAGRTDTSTIQNITISNSSVYSYQDMAGTFAGKMYLSTIEWCKAYNVSIDCKDDYVGGITGYFQESNAYRVGFEGGHIGTVDDSDRFVAGFAGYIRDSRQHDIYITNTTIWGGNTDYTAYFSGQETSSVPCQNHRIIIASVDINHANGIFGHIPTGQPDNKDVYLENIFNTDDMKSKCYYPNFDFNNVWQIDYNINSGYPSLQGVDPSPPSQQKPYVYNIIPYNGKHFDYVFLPGSVHTKPMLNISLDDYDSDTMNVTWYISEDGINWTWVQTNNSLPSCSVATYYYKQANKTDTRYWWKINVTDGIFQDEYIFNFTTAPWCGNGTIDNPYQITNFSQLENVSYDVTSHYILMNDIDAYDSRNTSSNGWIPIGTSTYPFKGTFNGNNHTIRNLYWKNKGHAGLFGYIDDNNAWVKWLGMVNVYSHGSNSYQGAICGNLVSGLIECCFSTGSINSNADWRDCHGGLVGVLGSGGTIRYSWSNCTVGECGYSCGRYRGVLVGRTETGSNIQYCYTAGYCPGNSGNAFIGIKFGGSQSHNFADTETATTGVTGATGLSTEKMKISCTYLSDGWDLNNIWQLSKNINEGYPSLRSFGVDTENDAPTIYEVYPANHSIYIPQSSIVSFYLNDNELDTVDINWYISRDGINWTWVQSIGSATTCNQYTYHYSSATEYRGNYYWKVTLDDGTNTSSYFFNFTVAPYPGNGTSDNPFKIYNLSYLQYLSECDGQYYFEQQNNLDATGVDWIPITNFEGIYDGNYNHISNLHINGSTNNIGLFGNTISATIKRLGIDDVYISTSNSQVGGLIGYAEGTTIEECYTTGYIKGRNNVGGLIGNLQNSDILNCYSRVFINSSYQATGGLIGYAYSSDYENCYYAGEFGKSLSDGYVNPMLGKSAVPVNAINSFWDEDLLTDSTMWAPQGTPKNTSEMTDCYTFINAGWDFDNVWTQFSGCNDNYMVLKYVNPCPTCIILNTPKNGSLLDRQDYAILNVTIPGTFGDNLTRVIFYNASDNSKLIQFNDTTPGFFEYNWANLTPGKRYYWYVMVNGSLLNSTSDTWFFIPNDEPKVLNLRIDKINSNNISIKWENEPNQEWISFRIGNEFMEVRKILGQYQTWNISNLYENQLYTFEWQTGDNLTSFSDYYNFDFRTEGWHPDLINYTYRKLITINSSELTSDLDNYAVNITLNETNFRYSGENPWDPSYPAFLHVNNSNDFCFVNYYNTRILNYSLTSWNIPQNKGVSYQTIPNETYYTGAFINPEYAHDGNWLTKATPNSTGVLYYNYTIPSDVKTTSKFRCYQGDWIWDVELPTGAYTGSKLRFKSVCNYTKPFIATYIWDYDLNNWILAWDSAWGDSNSTSRYFYESMMTWEYYTNVSFIVMPEHFNDDLQKNVDGLDSNYDIKLWLYYGNENATNHETTFSYAGIKTIPITIDEEQQVTLSPPTIYNVVESNKTTTSINISWDVNEPADNRIRYATNPWMFGYTWVNYPTNKTETFQHLYGNESHIVKLNVYSTEYISTLNVTCSNSTYNNQYSINSSTGDAPVEITFYDCDTDEYLNWTITYRYNKTYDRATHHPEFTLELPTNTTYYYEVWSFGAGGNSSESGSFTLGTPPLTPTGEIIGYDENRPDAQVTIYGQISDLNDNPSINVSLQYWNETSTNFSETPSITLSETGEINFTIDVEYGRDYTYRLKLEGNTTGYSEIYSNRFMDIQEFFAGNYIEDNDNNGKNPYSRHRQYLPPNPDGTVNESAYGYEQTGYWEGSLQEEDWMWVETNITDEGQLMLHLYHRDNYSSPRVHVGDYPLTKDSDSDMNYIRLTGLDGWYTFYITGDSGIVLNWTKPSPIHLNHQTRKDESKWVEFNGTHSSIDYSLLYLTKEHYNSSAYRYAIAQGADIYTAMQVEYFGGGREAGIGPEISGTEYDRGRLFRGGITNGEMDDTGTLNYERKHTPMGDWVGCFAFTLYWWNESIIPSNNITNYYYRYWALNNRWSEYLGYSQTRLFDYNALFMWEYDQYSQTRDWKAINGTYIFTEKRVANVTPDVFQSDYPQSLLVGYKDGFNLDLGNDKIYNFGLYTDGRWTNQQLGEHQQAYIIFNLPDNATLQGMDSDADGINDYDELFVYYTNPKCNDTDEDGQTDGFEISTGHDPNLYTDLNLPPDILIIEPANISYLSNEQIPIVVYIVDLEGDETNYNITIWKNGIFVNTIATGTIVSNPLNFTWNTSTPGVYTLKVEAIDNHSAYSVELHNFTVTGFVFSTPSIPDGATNVTISTTEWSIYIEYQLGLFNWSIETNAGNNSATYDNNGTKYCPLHLQYDTNYTVYVNVTSIDGITYNKTYHFRTKADIPYDIIIDGHINYLDISSLVSHYLETGTPGWIRDDIDDNGKVNYLDISILISHYGEM